MEDSSVHHVPLANDGKEYAFNIDSEIRRSTRELPPAHYTLKIESFSQLCEVLKKTKEEKFESNDFESGGYKWKLRLYPSGNAKRNGDGHVSLYLALAETNAIPLGGEVNVIITFFVFDHIRNNYLTVQDGRVMRFHALKTEHGFDKLLPLSTFNDSSSGYLVADCCVFGAKVCVMKCQGKGEKFSVIEAPKSSTFTWKIEKFSTLEESYYCSNEFSDGQRIWKVNLYPKGESGCHGQNLSCFLHLISDSKSVSTPRIYVEYTLSIKDQVKESHYEITGNSWFKDGLDNWGYSDFMSLSDLYDASKGYLVNDTLIFEAEINRLSFIETLS